MLCMHVYMYVCICMYVCMHVCMYVPTLAKLGLENLEGLQNF